MLLPAVSEEAKKTLFPFFLFVRLGVTIEDILTISIVL